jgi:hypothetical protein
VFGPAAFSELLEEEGQGGPSRWKGFPSTHRHEPLARIRTEE